MPYIINFTDKENKTPITVFDNTSNTDTSLTFQEETLQDTDRLLQKIFYHY